MRDFAFSSPSSLAEAIDLLTEYGARAKLIAGGTDLLVQMKNGLITPERVISLSNVRELSVIERGEGQLRIGALVRHATLEHTSFVSENAEILTDAARKVGSPQIRNLGTVGGNVCNASPAADTAPALLVLESDVVLVSQRGERRISLESFFTGGGSTALEHDELLKEILIPEVPLGSVWAYIKHGIRKCMTLSIAATAVLLTIDSNRICQRARVALGAVASKPMRAREAEQYLEGRFICEEVIWEAADRAQKECHPISDVRASANYRKKMVRILVSRAIKKSLGLPI